MIKVRFFCLSLFLFFLMLGVSQAGKNEMSLTIYSGINFIKEAGEFYGIEVIEIPYYKGEKIIWRSASGKIGEPLILNAVRDGNKIKFVVPDEDIFSGEWIIVIRDKFSQAIGPRDLKFNLKVKKIE